MRWGSRAIRDTIDRVITERVILFVGWVWFLVYAYPGYMSYDSVWQLSQARGHEPINEWHPPMMTLIWRYTDKLIAGPFPMLAIQSIALLLGLAAIFRYVMSRRAAAVTAVVILLLPQTIIVMAVIWKDAQMAGYLMVAIACLLSNNRRWRITGYVFLFLATAMRYNAAASTFPIVLLLWNRRGPGWIESATGRSMHWVRRYATATGVWIAITASAFIVSGQIVEKKVHPWPLSVATTEIAAVLAFAPDLDSDQLVRDHPDVPWAHTDLVQDRARWSYHPVNTFLELVDGRIPLFTTPRTDKQRAALTKLWKTLVFTYPIAFAKHRFSQFYEQLKTGVGLYIAFINAEWAEDHLHHRATHSKVQDKWISVLASLIKKRVFRAHMYFVIALILILLSRGHRLAFILFASAITHELGLLLVAPAVDYRYSHWMVVATIMGAVIMFTERYRRGRELRAAGIERGAQPPGAALVPDAPAAQDDR